MTLSYIWSVGIYDRETWTSNKKIRNKINLFERRIYHGVLKIGWKDRVSSKEERERMLIFSSIAKIKTAFFGHTCRGSSGNDIVTILEGNVDRIRSRGEENGQKT